MDTPESIAQLFGFDAQKPLQPPRYAKVTAISGDSVTVQLGTATVEAVRCCLCNVGDVVLLETLPNGTLAAVATKGIQPATGQDTTYTISGSVSDHAYTTTLTGSDGSTDTATLHLAAGANVTLTDGTGTVTIAAKDTTYSNATTTTAGLMSPTDKAYLDSLPTALAGKQDTITAGTGLSKSGNTLNHSNAVTAGTVGTSSATSGNTLAVPWVTFDAQGHETARGTHTHTVTAEPPSFSSLGSVALNVKDLALYGMCALTATAGTNESSPNGWGKVASGSFNGTYRNAVLTFALCGTFMFDYNMSNTDKGFGFLYLNVRHNYAGNNAIHGFHLYGSSGLNPDHFALVIDNENDTWTLYYKVVLQYYRMQFTLLSRGGTNASEQWHQLEALSPVTLYNAQPLVSDIGTYTSANMARVQSNTSYYGTCSTAAGTAAKVVECPGFVLTTGARISVQMWTDNTVAVPTLNVNGTGAKYVVKNGSVGTTSNALIWRYNEVLDFVYDGTYWRIVSQLATVCNSSARPTSANTATVGSHSMRHFQSSSSMTSGKPAGDGHILEFDWDTATANHAQLYLPMGPASHNTAWPQWRSQRDGANTWTEWDTFYTEANPPAFSDLTGTATPAQLPIATTSAVGAVRPDGQSIIVQDGVLTATPAAVGLTCTERKGGTQLDDISLVQDGQAWPGGDSAYGWKEEVWNDGRLHVQMWRWWNMTTTGVQNRAVSFDWTKCDTTKFVDIPTVKVDTWVRYTSASSPVAVYGSVNEMSVNNSINLVLSKGSGGGAYAYVMLDLEGHWHIEGQEEPEDPSDYGDWTVGDAVSIGGSTYYPVTDWTVSATGAGGDNRLKAAVRFLITSTSTSGSWHVYAQYAAWTDTGYVNTNNGYMLIRKLNSSITTYTNDAGVKAKGDVWSTLNQNQRQGYVYNGQTAGNLIWGDTPYILTDCGTVGNGVTVSSKTFYVGTTESGYPQCSVSASTTTPTA